MDQITHKVRDQHWLRVIQECNASGLTRREWCQQNGISTKTFYYHQRKLRQEAYFQKEEKISCGKFPVLQNLEFAEIAFPTSAPTGDHSENRGEAFQPDAVIRKDALTIEISNHTSKTVLEFIRAVITHAP